jgi:agmatine/peptidylarginine deiminase
LQGGNLLCNGQHLALTTARVFEDNAITFPNPLPGMDVQAEARKMVIDAISEGCNLQQLVILEPLQNEATKHCDMFASFLDTDKVVVAQLDPSRDSENAAILDRNAGRLEAVIVNGRPLQVTRIPIPPRHGRSWSALTNVIIANDLVLMPVYDSDPPEIIQAAVGIYERLLPGHAIKTVDISTFKKLQGELHCLSMHLPQFAAMPSTITFGEAVQLKQKIE